MSFIFKGCTDLFLLIAYIVKVMIIAIAIDRRYCIFQSPTNQSRRLLVNADHRVKGVLEMR